MCINHVIYKRGLIIENHIMQNMLIKEYKILCHILNITQQIYL